MNESEVCGRIEANPDERRRGDEAAVVLPEEIPEQLADAAGDQKVIRIYRFRRSFASRSSTPALRSFGST